MTPHPDPLMHPDPDRHPTRGPMGAVYIVLYVAGFFLLMPGFGIAAFGFLLTRSPLSALISVAGGLVSGAVARAAWRRMP
jgi:hypothetical protein